MEDIIRAPTPENYTIHDVRNPFGETKDDEIKWAVVSPDGSFIFMVNKQKFGKWHISTEAWQELTYEDDDLLTVCSLKDKHGNQIAYVGSKMGVL